MTAAKAADRLGKIGVWAMELAWGEAGAVAEAAAEIEALGFGAIWIPGGHGGDVLLAMSRLLAATKRITIASGIINIWRNEPAAIGAWWRGLSADHQSRTMLGLGVGHAPAIVEYRKPLSKMQEYLDELDAEGIPADHRCLAALGPKMIELSRDRSAGAHPYLITPKHTAEARQLLGPGALLAPEQGVIFETDPAKARRIAREALTIYMRLPNYVNNWRRLGFNEADVTGPSDTLLDALFAWGDVAPIAERARAHLAAGADHVCLQVVTGAPNRDPAPVREAWRQIAKTLF
jgi:probable F420-dependent oxidoreductase